MAQFGGGSKLGGGSQFGGGQSVYERQRDTLFDLMGDGIFTTHKADSTKVITRVLSAVAGQFEGAEVDAERVFTEGHGSTAVETVREWARIYVIDNTDVSDDALRAMLRALSESECLYTTTDRLDTLIEKLMTLTGDGRTAEAYAHECTMAQCTATDNAGDGCRYIAFLVPQWFWDKYRAYYRAALELCDRLTPHFCEVSLCVSNNSVPMTKDLNLAEPAFYCNKSIVDRDVVRD